MARNAKPTDPQDIATGRQGLVAAGFRLAERVALPQFRADAIAREAGMPARSLTKYFAGRDDVLRAMHRQLLDEMLGAVSAGLSGKSSGPKRVWAGVEAVLDVLVGRLGVRRLILAAEARGILGRQVEARRFGFRQMLKIEYEAMGWRNAAETAHLMRVLIEEVALAETQAQRPLPPLREALRLLLGQTSKDY